MNRQSIQGLGQSRGIAQATSEQATQHYLALDGLRGVAALVVVWYHIFEAFASSPLDQTFNHGYLAVDFFFLLSGFVISHAYDGRWGQMNEGTFFRRRLVRLHPMLLFGALLGGLMFYTQMTVTDTLNAVPLSSLVVATLANMLLIPATASIDIRGYTEIFPLNGPTWSLFFEYLANILYALLLRRLSDRMLFILVCVSALGLAYEGLVHSPWGYLGAGWSFAEGGFWGGLARVGFSFSAGLLLCRKFRPIRFKWGFELGAVLLVALLSMPRIGGAEGLWQNALYELVCCIIIFPTLLFLGASTEVSKPKSIRLMRLLGDLSYPLYIIHFPFIYLYIAWVHTEGLSFAQSLPGALGLFFGCILLAYLMLKIYDEPIRRKLATYFLRRGHRSAQ